jgi:hypothetical protein
MKRPSAHPYIIARKADTRRQFMCLKHVAKKKNNTA